MSAQPDSPFEAFDEATHLRLRAAQALCSLVESLAMAGKIRHARRAMEAVQRVIDQTARLTVLPLADSAPSNELQNCLKELRHRARNAETVLKLLE